MNLLDKEYKRTKMLVHKPIPGYWYASIAGQLQQVRMVLLEGHEQRKVVLENINGRRQIVDLEGWYLLDLALHSPGNERRQRRRSDDSGKDPS
ncbi:MAG: hypothetical protein BMS9Abin09_0921 [Gammaproteobacteria bacterium]|nr:MAG: hypothetical protein BMS9Abin09_0921 [Gammaproteobacteria bacterium]